MIIVISNDYSLLSDNHFQSLLLSDKPGYFYLKCSPSDLRESLSSLIKSQDCIGCVIVVDSVNYKIMCTMFSKLLHQAGAVHCFKNDGDYFEWELRAEHHINDQSFNKLINDVVGQKSSFRKP